MNFQTTFDGLIVRWGVDLSMILASWHKPQ